MHRFDKCRIIDADATQGHVVCEWWDSSKPEIERVYRRLNHRIPIEAEEFEWSKEKLMEYWSNEVEDVATIPEWVKDHIHNRIDNLLK